jgi:hypothetical protein
MVGYCVLRTPVGYCVLLSVRVAVPLMRWLGSSHWSFLAHCVLAAHGLAFVRFAGGWCEGPAGVT